MINKIIFTPNRIQFKGSNKPKPKQTKEKKSPFAERRHILNSNMGSRFNHYSRA